MIVQAKCIQRAWDSSSAVQYVPNGGPIQGGLYELDLSNPAHRKLCDLKVGKLGFVFQFDRVAANAPASGLYFCSDCGARFDTLNLLGSHSREVHKNTGWNPPKEDIDVEPEPEEPKPVSRRGKVLMHCKGCGQPFDNVRVLVAHKPDCPGKKTEAVAPAASEEVAQGAPPA